MRRYGEKRGEIILKGKHTAGVSEKNSELFSLIILLFEVSLHVFLLLFFVVFYGRS